MKTIIPIVYLLLFPFLLNAQTTPPGVISQRLSQKIEEDAGHFLPVYLVLSERLDIRRLESAMQRSGASQRARVRRIVEGLQQKAASTQLPILEKLRRSEGVRPGSIRSFWLSNLIFLEADRRLIEKLAGRPDIASIDLERSLLLIEPVEAQAQAESPSGNSSEPGLKAINAHRLWDLGYTGYGTKALIIDSGVDPDHPALRDKFFGYYSPLPQAWSGNAWPEACSDHGTHVAGTILGLDRGTNDTIGVAYNSSWMGGPVHLDECSYQQTVRSIIATLQWALNPDGDLSMTGDLPEVINNSWATFDLECDDWLAEAVQALEAAGIALVWAAGNSGPAPMSLPGFQNTNFDLVNTFTVGALDAQSGDLPIAEFSSRGPSLCGGEGALHIKPEVTAPGVAIRSAVPGGGYAFLSGTSMASPHVSGAILLLKEAFPYLSGKELKLALYLTAQDLGIQGEDNTYGRGLIDVYAAYTYLNNLGNVPVTPASHTNDVQLLALEAQDQLFPAPFSLTITFKNDGEVPLSGLLVEYAFCGVDTIIGQSAWSGLLAPGEITTLGLPELNIPPGTYLLSISLQQPNGEQDERPLNNRSGKMIRIFDLSDPLVHLSGADIICEGSQALLSCDYLQASNIKWYAAENANIPIGTGNPLLSSSLSFTDTFYAEPEIIDQAGPLGAPYTDLSVPDSPQYKGLEFDCHHPFLLRSVKIFALVPGIRLLALYDANGQLLDTRSVPVSQSGPQRIQLDLPVPRHNGLRLLMLTKKPLYRQTTGASFPFSIPGVLTIRRSFPHSQAPDAYNYFFDWEVSFIHPSGRLPLEVPVLSSSDPLQADFGISTSSDAIYEGDPVSFQDQSTGAVSWQWRFGDGEHSTLQHPSHTYDAEGSYLVTLTTASGQGCSDATGKDIFIEKEQAIFIENDGLGSFSQLITLFPNPVEDVLYGSILLDEGQRIQVELIDIHGRMSHSGIIDASSGGHFEWNVAALPGGVYYLRLWDGDKQWVRPVVVSGNAGRL